MLEGEVLQAAFRLRVQQSCAGEQINAFAAKDIFHHLGGVRVKVPQQMRAALEQRHPHAEACEELRELHCHRPAAEHDERLGQPFERHRGVAGEVADRRELRERRRGHSGAGAENKVRAREPLAVIQLDRVWINKTDVGTDELETSALQLPPPVTGEVGNHRVLARHDLGEVEPHFRHLNPPRRGVLGKVLHLGRVKQRLGGHAAAQNAKSADFLAAFDDRSPEAAAGRRTGRRIARTATADHHHIEVRTAVRTHVARLGGRRK